MFLGGSALRRSYDDHWAGLAPVTALGPEPRPPKANQPSPLVEPAEPIPTRARTSAFGRLRHWPWSLARAGGAVRRSETFITISDRQLPPGHDPGADCGAAPHGRQRGSRPCNILVESRGYLMPRRSERPRGTIDDRLGSAPDEPIAALSAQARR